MFYYVAFYLSFILYAQLHISLVSPLYLNYFLHFPLSAWMSHLNLLSS